MAIVSDGVTTVDLGLSFEIPAPGVEKSTTLTGGGNTRSITSGERFRMSVESRVTATLLRTFLDLMLNGASSYFFTPSDITQWSALYPRINFPLNSNIFNISRQWDRRTLYYVNFDVESTSYV